MSVVVLGQFEIEKWKEALASRGVELTVVGPNGGFQGVLIRGGGYEVGRVFSEGIRTSDLLEALVALEDLKAKECEARGDGFERALEDLKDGKKVAREGWNGKGMFLFLVPGSKFKVNRAPLLGIYPEGTEIDYCPHIDMKTVDGKVVPWLASQTDMLAEDWVLVD